MRPDREPSRLRKEPPLGNFPRIYSPEAFDRLLAEKPQLKATIAGFSTVSLKQLLKAPDGSVMPWRDNTRERVNIELNERAYRHVYKEGPLTDDPNTFPDNLYDNRSFGYVWNIRELFQEIEPGVSWDNINSLLDPIAYLSKPSLKKLGETSASTYGDLLDSLEFPDAWDQDAIENYQYDLFGLYSLGFSTPENFFRFLREIPRRKGVQIVYGPADQFIDFLNQQETPYNPMDDTAIEVFSSIPKELVMAIIPLGDYEKQVLLDNE